MRTARGGEHHRGLCGAGGHQAADEAVRAGRQPLRVQRPQVGDRQSQGLNITVSITPRRPPVSLSVSGVIAIYKINYF